jgi:S1-C subfamily serine protease
MRTVHWTGWLLAILFAVLLVPFTAQHMRVLGNPGAKPAMAQAFLKVSTPLGHGAGVHIGDGYILTAAHVVGDNKAMTIEDTEGRSVSADVLWSNRGYDVALLKVAGYGNIGVAPLSCEPNYVGQKVKAYGNPMDLDFVHTSGEVNGKARQWAMWKWLVPADLVVIPGQSGGAVVDTSGRVVGITVGVMVFQMGLTGQGFFVPATVACDLMGRA